MDLSLEELTVKRNKSRKGVVNHFIEGKNVEYDEIYDKIIESEDHIIIQGPGGSGKTTLANQLLSYYEDELIMTATTGSAA